VITYLDDKKDTDAVLKCSKRTLSVCAAGTLKLQAMSYINSYFVSDFIMLGLILGLINIFQRINSSRILEAFSA
jgi:hypothetical protein